jgi:hypothetical protein
MSKNILLDVENKDLIGVPDERINYLLKLGKMVEKNMTKEKEQIDIQATIQFILKSMPNNNEAIELMLERTLPEILKRHGGADKRELAIASTDIKMNVDKSIESLRNEVKSVLGKTVAKGNIAEVEIAKYIESECPEYEIKDSSKVAHSSDITMTYKKFYFAIECKNYARNVPSDQLTKFKLDLDSNKPAKGGIFVNYMLGVATVKKDIEFMQTDKGKPIFVISKFVEYPRKLIIAIKYLEAWVDTIIKINQKMKNTQLAEEKLEIATARINEFNSKKQALNKLINAHVSNNIEQLHVLSQNAMKLLE